MRVALVADWLPVFAGAEHVLAELHALWPDAPIYTTVARHAALGPLRDADIRVSKLQQWYTLLRRHQILLPWMPEAVERMDLSDFDVIISSSHAIGKGVIPPSSAVHICYCHTPMRYAWEMEQQYLEDFGIPKMLQSPIKKQLKRIRRWDLTSAKRVDHFIANSETTQERIARTYARESTVIHPPVRDQFFFTPLEKKGADDARPYYLAIGRLVPYKRFDLLIQAANTLQFPLKIAGSGPDEARLRRMAGPTVEMLGFVADSQLPSLYTGAKALLFPQFEDAGVVPLEAQASGTPVIAFARGGALDTVKDGVTGVFFKDQSVSALEGAMRTFEETTFDPTLIREHARNFSAKRFRASVSAFVEATTQSHSPTSISSSISPTSSSSTSSRVTTPTV